MNKRQRKKELKKDPDYVMNNLLKVTFEKAFTREYLKHLKTIELPK